MVICAERNNKGGVGGGGDEKDVTGSHGSTQWRKAGVTDRGEGRVRAEETAGAKVLGQTHACALGAVRRAVWMACGWGHSGGEEGRGEGPGHG